MSAPTDTAAKSPESGRAHRRVPTALFVTLTILFALVAIGSVTFLLAGLLTRSVVVAEVAQLEERRSDRSAAWAEATAKRAAEQKAEQKAEQELISTWTKEGWTHASSHVFYRWAEPGQYPCGDYPCLTLEISTTDVACPNHVAVKAHMQIDRRTVEDIDRRTQGLGTFSDALLTFENRTGNDISGIHVNPPDVDCR